LSRATTVILRLFTDGVLADRIRTSGVALRLLIEPGSKQSVRTSQASPDAEVPYPTLSGCWNTTEVHGGLQGSSGVCAF